MVKVFFLIIFTLSSFSLIAQVQLPSPAILDNRLVPECKNLPKFQYTIDSTDIFYIKNINLNKPSDSIPLFFYEEIAKDYFSPRDINLGFKDMEVGFAENPLVIKKTLPKVMYGWVNFNTPEGYTTQFMFRIGYSGNLVQFQMNGIREYYNKELGSPYLKDLVDMIKSPEARLKRPDICRRVIDYDNRAKLILDKFEHLLLSEAVNYKYKPRHFYMIECD